LDKGDWIMAIILGGFAMMVLLWALYDDSMTEKCDRVVIDGKIIDRWGEYHTTGKTSHRHYYTMVDVLGIKESIDDEDLWFDDTHIGDTVKLTVYRYNDSDGNQKIYKIIRN
jgi:hypothetical protein